MPEYPFVATVHRPGLPEVRLGFTFRHQAEQACISLQQDLVATTHLEGTTITWAPLDPGSPEPEPPILTDPYQLAGLLADDTYRGESEQFPDLYARLKAQIGYEEASRTWLAACDLLDAAPTEED